MQLISKYNNEDIVYFLHNNAVHEARIQGTIFPKHEIIPNGQGGLMEVGYDRHVEYTFFKRSISQEYYLLRNMDNTVVKIAEYKIFKTKEDLIASL